MAASKLEAQSKRLAKDICKMLGARPTHGQFGQVVDVIQAELAPDREATMKIIKALPELLADYEHCALDADGRLDPSRARSISKIRQQVEAVLKGQ